MAKRIITRPRTPVAAQLLDQRRGTAEQLVVDWSDPINRDLHACLVFSGNKGQLVEDLCGNDEVLIHPNHSWTTTPDGPGLRVGDDDGGKGFAVPVGTGGYLGSLWSIAHHLRLEEPLGGGYPPVWEFGVRNKSMLFRSVGVRLDGSGGPIDFPHIIPAQKKLSCIVITQDGVGYNNTYYTGYLNGVAGAGTTFSNTGLSSPFGYNSGIGTDRPDRVDYFIRFWTRRLTAQEAVRLYQNMTAGLKPANDRAFVYPSAAPEPPTENYPLFYGTNF